MIVMIFLGSQPQKKETQFLLKILKSNSFTRHLAYPGFVKSNLSDLIFNFLWEKFGFNPSCFAQFIFDS